MNRHHRFGSAYASQAFSASRDLWNTVLFECESFVALPSVGALVEGWLLVVPKSPALSIGTLSLGDRMQLIEFVRSVVPQLEARFGSVAAFEHGPSASNCAIGCGVDYAHLHLVPTDCDLLQEASAKAPGINWQPAHSLLDTAVVSRRGLSYIFLQQPFDSGTAYIGTGDELPSQLFRRVIAEHIGVPHRYDWKINPGVEMIARTVSSLSSNATGRQRELAVR